MPRYFFDIVDDDGAMRDDEGLVLPDPEAARREAIASLLDIARDELSDGDHRSFVLTVHDSDGRSLLSVRLAVDAEWLAQAR